MANGNWKSIRGIFMGVVTASHGHVIVEYECILILLRFMHMDIRAPWKLWIPRNEFLNLDVDLQVLYLATKFLASKVIYMLTISISK